MAKYKMPKHPIRLNIRSKSNVYELLLEEYPRYLSKVLSNMFVNEDGCWIWTGCRDPKNGYGQISIYRHKFKVHRFIAFCFNGLDLMNLKLDACHSCDTRSCINPLHIWVGTRGENLKDSARKGRWHGGSYAFGNFYNDLPVRDW